MSLSPPPPPRPASDSPAPTGGTIVSSAWSALRQDRELISLPIIGALVALLAVAPLVLVALIPENGSPGQIVIAVVAAFVGAIVTTFFAVALAAGAHSRMNGGDPTVRSSLGVAWSHKRGVVGWALLTTTVGLVLRGIESRFRGAGTLIRFLGDMAWSLASFFVIPIIAANDCGPIEAIKLSTKTFKDRWSSAVRVSFRLTLYTVGLVLGLIAGAAIVIALSGVSLALAVLVGIVLGAAWLVAMLVMSALTSYARVALYRYASGLPTPGFAAATLASTVTARASRRSLSRW